MFLGQVAQNKNENKNNNACFSRHCQELESLCMLLLNSDGTELNEATSGASSFQQNVGHTYIARHLVQIFSNAQVAGA